MVKKSKKILVTGSFGLIGLESCLFYLNKGYDVIGIDNNLRKFFFGEIASTKINLKILNSYSNYKHFNCDIRNILEISRIFEKFNDDIKLIIHTAAQPSHDWAAKDPITDFTVNANGTLNLLNSFKKFSSKAVFIFTSTNKVYGDRPNYLPLKEFSTRYEIDKKHIFYKNGINENMSIDNTLHSLFGVSKTSADLLVQEFGKYFNLKTACFRGGCLTGENHSGAELHGFLSYLVKCIVNKNKYKIFGYNGKQVRDNIHSNDLVRAFNCFFKNPKKGSNVYNIGGGRKNSCSILEAITLIEKNSGFKANYSLKKDNRIGDHKWWISDNSKFIKDYPDWSIKKPLESIIIDIINKTL